LRPLLTPDAFVRCYLGQAGRFWVIVRGPGRTRVRIDSELRAILDVCDGGRKSAQIARDAMTRRQLSAIEVERILQPLIREGVVHDLDGPPPRETRTPGEIGLRLELLDDETLARLQLVPAQMGLGCHSRGGCCHLYDRLRIDGAEVARIREAYGDELVPGGLSVDGAVMRERGDEDVFGLAVSGGGCVLLQPDGHCGVHARMGAAQKPAGCRTYPLRDVKCGDELHVGVAIECRCSVDFAGGDRAALLAEAEILLERRKRTRLVESVADEVTLADKKVARADYLAWRTEATARLSRASDVLDWTGEALPAVAPSDAFIEPLQHWLAFEAGDLARLYDASDLQTRLLHWAHQASRELPSSHAAVEGERLAAEQLLFGHGFLRSTSVSLALTSFALRIRLARAGAAIPLPAELLPIVVVEYLGRVYSLGHIFD
jgi:hypothetical protein